MVVRRISEKARGIRRNSDSFEVTDADFQKLNPTLFKKWKTCIKESEKLRSRSHIYKYLSGDYMKSFTTGLQYDVKVAHNQTKHEA